jgi:hypothetical protein
MRGAVRSGHRQRPSLSRLADHAGELGQHGDLRIRVLAWGHPFLERIRSRRLCERHSRDRPALRRYLAWPAKRHNPPYRDHHERASAHAASPDRHCGNRRPPVPRHRPADRASPACPAKSGPAGPTALLLTGIVVATAISTILDAALVATVSLGVDELDSGAEPLGRARRPDGDRKRAAGIRAWSRRCLPWSSLASGAIRCRRCGGRRSRPARWRPS